MPKYTVTDPQSGRKVTLTGDSPPTEQELEEIFSSLPASTAAPTAQAAPVRQYQDENSDVPQLGADGRQLPRRPNRNIEPTMSLLENPIVGGLEAAGGAVLGGLAGAGGQIAGTVKGIGQSVLNGTYGTQAGSDAASQEAARYAQAASAPFMPRTETGKEYLGNVAEFAEPLAGLAPLRQAAIIGQSARAAAPLSGLRSVEPGVNGIVNDAASLKSKSMGAAQTDMATLRRERAAQLPVDPKLTEGQATRDYDKIRFEGEAMKGELGAPLRQRAAEQHQALRQSLDEWIDQTGAQSSDIRSTGIAIDKALGDKAKAQKNRIREAYKKADESGEMAQPISPKAIVDTLNNSRSAESTAPVLTAARKEILRLGGAVEGEDGNLIPKDLSLGDAEQLRKFVNSVTGYEPANVKFAGDLKSAIDGETQNAGGDIYRAARRMREKYGNEFQNKAVIADVMKNKKGSADRAVAFEDVFDRIVFRGSLDDVRTVRKSLQTGSEDGQQAWRELQGAGLRYIRDEATKNVARGFDGEEMISPAGLNRAITRLDTDGKLDFIYGKNGAQKLRDINDISKDLFTAPPGAINHSNTASVLTAALDIMASGTAGLPLPIASGARIAIKNIKDRRLKAKIQKALGNYDKEDDK